MVGFLLGCVDVNSSHLCTAVIGWYEGERMRDLQWGWFPSNFTVEIENEHTKARNLREWHRLLSLPFTNPQNFAQHVKAVS